MRDCLGDVHERQKCCGLLPEREQKCGGRFTTCAGRRGREDIRKQGRISTISGTQNMTIVEWAKEGERV